MLISCYCQPAQTYNIISPTYVKGLLGFQLWQYFPDFILDVCGSLLNVCVFTDMSVWLLSLHASRTKNRVTKSITLTSQGVSLSCYKWLPQWLACQGWEISHTVACKRLSVNCHGSLSSIFISLSSIPDATRSENPLGNRNLKEVRWMILSSLAKV